MAIVFFNSQKSFCSICQPFFFLAMWQNSPQKKTLVLTSTFREKMCVEKLKIPIGGVANVYTFLCFCSCF
jgi:hypothetical protein